MADDDMVMDDDEESLASDEADESESVVSYWVWSLLL